MKCSLPKVKKVDLFSLAKCPFCGSYNVSIVMREKMCVHCNECDANGPQGWVAEECVERWNDVSIRSAMIRSTI